MKSCVHTWAENGFLCDTEIFVQITGSKWIDLLACLKVHAGLIDV